MSMMTALLNSGKEILRDAATPFGALMRSGYHRPDMTSDHLFADQRRSRPPLPGRLVSLVVSFSCAVAGHCQNAGPSSLPAAGFPRPDILEFLSGGAYLAVAGEYGGAVAVEPSILYPTKPRRTVAGPSLVLDPKIGPNTRLGQDPVELGEMHHQAEPHIVRDMFDPDFLVATFQEGRFASGGGGLNCGYSVSNDGGRTWSRALIPLLTAISGGPFARATDPVAGIGHLGQVYLNTLALPADNSGNRIMVSISVDRGATFGAPVEAVAPPAAGDFLDKNWMAVDTHPDSPRQGRMIVTFTNFRAGPGGWPIMAVVSDDGGTTWTSPATLVTRVEGFYQGSQPLFLPRGLLAVVYWNFGASSFNFSDDRIEMVLSADGGDTFGDPLVVVGDLEYYDHPVLRDGAFLPAAAADRETGVIYVSYQAVVDGRPRIVFTRSLDHGTTWSQPVAVSDNPTGASVATPAIAASPDGQHVVITYYDDRVDQADQFTFDRFLAESFDGGVQWEPSLRISDTSTDARDAVRITSGGQNGQYMLGDYMGVAPSVGFDYPAVPIWIDARFGSPDPFVTRVDRTQGSRFEVWRSLYFSEFQHENEEISGPAADPDGDGVSNLLEYFLASDPLLPSRRAFELLSLSGGQGGVFSLAFFRNPVADDLVELWESSEDLDHWAPSVPLLEDTHWEGEAGSERVVIDLSVESADIRYLRLNLEYPSTP